MRFYFTFLVIFSCIFITLGTTQEPAPAPVRTPEQEAALQTQKMQKELNLNNNQLQSIYEINLKHARERQVSNSRSKALERSKNKNSEIRQVLTPDQYNRLQDRRYERYPVDGSINNRTTTPQQQRTQPASERRSETVTPRVNRENLQNRTPAVRQQTPNTNTRTAAPSSNRNIQVNPSVRNNNQVPTRGTTTTRPPSNNSGNNDRSQRR
ncbi:MAG TPA: hypothetical protein DEH15_07185 [Marinilabiliales bacterium]|nr:hypothetical protein [Marinilabiliales bacterium]